MVEPQRVPSVPSEAVFLALSRARWCSMPVASSEAVCVPFLCPMEGVYHGRAAAHALCAR